MRRQQDSNRSDASPRDDRAASAPRGRRLPDVIGVLLATGQYDLAFEKIYERLFGKVFGFIAANSAAGDDAEDLTRDVFLRVCRHLPHYDTQRASLETWVYVIAANTLFDRDRPETRRPDADAELAQAYALQEQRDTLAKLLRRLPEIDRHIVVLRYFRGLSSQATADILGMTSGNVRVRLSRALDKLTRFAGTVAEEAEVVRN